MNSVPGLPRPDQCRELLTLVVKQGGQGLTQAQGARGAKKVRPGWGRGGFGRKVCLAYGRPPIWSAG
jgi:hypothetical protein